MIERPHFPDAQLTLAEGVRQLSSQTWEADSAVQALAWLRCHLYWPATVAAKVRREGGFEMRLQQRVFFRGHADATWEPLPHLLRFQGDLFHQARRAAKLAASIVDVEFQTLWSADGTQQWPPLVKDTGYAAVQHYGIPTSLLDWSANPSVAVHFATCSESSKTSSMASILWLSVGDASDLGLRIILAPPYVPRLYIQRGLFTELSLHRGKDLMGRCGKIVFPAQPPYPALFTTDGNNTVEIDLLPAGRWFEDLKTWTWEQAFDETLAADHIGANMAFVNRHGHHPAIQNYSEAAALFLGADHLAAIMDYVFELAGRSTREGQCYDPRILNVLEKDNHEFFHWLHERGEKLPRCY